jgi:hypothetical protein
MTLDELIDRLTEIREEVGGEFPVRGAFQPNYVLLAEIDAVSTITESGDADGVFIALSDSHDYGSGIHYSDEVVYATISDYEEEYA